MRATRAQIQCGSSSVMLSGTSHAISRLSPIAGGGPGQVVRQPLAEDVEADRMQRATGRGAVLVDDLDEDRRVAHGGSEGLADGRGLPFGLRCELAVHAGRVDVVDLGSGLPGGVAVEPADGGARGGIVIARSSRRSR